MPNEEMTQSEAMELLDACENKDEVEQLVKEITDVDLDKRGGMDTVKQKGREALMAFYSDENPAEDLAVEKAPEQVASPVVDTVPDTNPVPTSVENKVLVSKEEFKQAVAEAVAEQVTAMRSDAPSAVEQPAVQQVVQRVEDDTVAKSIEKVALGEKFLRKAVPRGKKWDGRIFKWNRYLAKNTEYVECDKDGKYLLDRDFEEIEV